MSDRVETDASSKEEKSSLEAGLKYLLSLQKNGLWSYIAGNEAAIEPSAWAAIALSDNVDCRNQFIESILSRQNSDGGWSNDSLRLESDWSTGAALLGISFIKSKCLLEKLEIKTPISKIETACTRAEQWIMENRTERYSSAARFALLLWKGPEHDYERGWPWTQNTFDWIEPTSYALLALKYSSIAGTPKVQRTMELAQNYILKLTCAIGGWNFGDRNPYGKENPPDIQSTALVLLALKPRRKDAKVAKSLKWMLEEVSKMESSAQLAWTAFALSSYSENSSDLMKGLLQEQDDNGSFSSNLLTHSIACLSLKTRQDPAMIA